MTRWCSICSKKGHITSECWYKPNYIKEITRENGKLKKKYTLPSLSKSRPTTQNSKNDKRDRSRSRSLSPAKLSINSKQQSIQPKPRKSPPRKPTNPVGDIDIVEIIKSSNSKPSKCPECLKWDTRMQHSLKYQEITRNEDKRVIKCLTEQNLRLNQQLQKAIKERDSFKTLYDLNKR